jgi:hypothetical protein
MDDFKSFVVFELFPYFNYPPPHKMLQKYVRFDTILVFCVKAALEQNVQGRLDRTGNYQNSAMRADA